MKVTTVEILKVPDLSPPVPQTSIPSAAPRNRTPITQYAIRGLPATMFIDAEGNLFRRWDGLITQFQLDTVIAEMLMMGSNSASCVVRQQRCVSDFAIRPALVLMKY